MQTTDDRPTVCPSFRGEIDHHYHANKLLQIAKIQLFFPLELIQNPFRMLIWFLLMVLDQHSCPCYR